MFHTPIGLNVLNGGVILALMSVPIIVSIGEDALKAVPDSYREAALALGVTRWQLIYRVLVPAARNGLLAAVLLGVGRAVGETMAVLMATGHAVKIPTSLLDSVRTLTATIAAELGEAAVHSDHYQVLFIIGILLFTITFVDQSGGRSDRARGAARIMFQATHSRAESGTMSCWPAPCFPDDAVDCHAPDPDCRATRSLNKRIEPMRRSAFRLVPHSGAVDALLLMAHPQRWPRMRQR